MTDQHKTREEQVAEYRARAEEAQRFAEVASTVDLQESFLKLAMSWLKLADDVQNSN